HRERGTAHARRRRGDGAHAVRAGTRGRGAAAVTTVTRRREFFSGTYAAVSLREPYGPGGPRPGERLTGRGGVLVVFAGCFLGLLVADWANWGELADAVFFMASSLTAYYVRPSGLLPVVVSPPLMFFAA